MATKTSLLGLTKPAYTEAADIAVLNTNFDLIDKAVGQGARVWNLLDNSYFPSAYVINQRGATSYSGSWARCIDRWICVTPGDAKFWSNPTNIGVPAGGRIVQCLNVKAADVVGKTYTLAFANTTGTVYMGSGTVKTPTDTTLYHIAQDNNGVIVWLYSVASDGYLYAVLYNNSSYTVPLVWAALYEGEYTAETLPAYVYKGYAAELAECQRYYLPLNHQLLGNGYTFSGGAALLIPCKMRIHNPSFNSSDTIMARVNGKDYSLTQSAIATYGSMIKVDFAGDVPANYPCAFYSSGASASLSADL